MSTHTLIVDDNASVLRRARRNVGERPRGLELQFGVLLALEELDETGHRTAADDLLDRWIALYDK